ncbi:NF-kappa-B inhibitor-like protein 1 isoform X2 [Hemicordylus capensis]|nr:NF-kappa-B inhibitor-like protein 1 isoform X2 [Hemicordylus capensis]XP_053159430.1 NF-kappa-B inhibitor-like protein 1 isoform X2 [Hemicordylus capensis]XP_053159431.1 NF-kappa-B inhibitor-like protein 1 isoform X2 [Hemicordylus capensis]XP_053159432.1 NF-kappa-B inhibitor-like protein 1 isoform X2 [Hemicordylus capensis]XP_053159433.1 NF-kappa-B inhibitor-like protein 1 isoform X2 [Hemicordylus capensis]XP_053159434.1 NF-kappa-B inhibitor-like protein 1 isoform X2 [Hemicordylus capensis]
MPIHMASRYQRRLWRYVNAGRRRKLHRLLKHHRKALDLSEAVGHKNRTPLHRSCARLDYKTVVLLLEYGADPSILDQQGDTALHVAARHVARKGGTAYEDLFVPLRNRCPSAMSIRNRDGKTPGDLLGQTKEKWCPQELLEERETERDADREWNRKLLGEWEDENPETCWQYEEDFYTTSPDPESYEEWFDRIAQEYRQKRRRVEEKPQQKPKTEAQKPSLKLRPLEEEHLLYEKRARAKEAELKEAKRQRYEEGCSRVFSTDSSCPLRYVDIPWPCPKGTPEEMAAVAVHGANPSDRAAYRRFIRRQQALWHPDKFAQRCGTRLAEQDRRRILDTVTALSQAFNRLAEAAK